MTGSNQHSSHDEASMTVFACDLSEERQQKFYDEQMREMDAFQATRWMRLLDWIEAHTTGEGSWPWAHSWHWRGFSFMFASGSYGFCFAFPLPRMLPGFVRSYQMQSLRTREGRRESDLTGFLPLYPPGLPHFSRTRRLRRRKR